MKKLICILLVLVLALALASCAGNENKSIIATIIGWFSAAEQYDPLVDPQVTPEKPFDDDSSPAPVDPPVTAAALPNVVGMTKESAAAALEEAGFNNIEYSEEYSDTVPTDSVISQSPSEGESVPFSGTVELVISRGPAPVTAAALPNVAGKTKENAAAALEAAGFSNIAYSEAYSSTVPAGSVISQSPAAGGVVPLEQKITLTISRGPAPVTSAALPNVVGMTKDEAVAVLSSAGFAKVKYDLKYSSAAARDSVTAQSRTAGRNTAFTETITLTVSLGAYTASGGYMSTDFTLSTLDGKSVSLSDYRGKTVFINFWATWCGPCVHEMGDIHALFEHYDSSVVFLMISVDDASDKNKVKSFLSTNGYEFTVLLDPYNNVFYSIYGDGRIPYTMIVDPNGYIRYTQLGAPYEAYSVYKSAIDAIK